MALEDYRSDMLNCSRCSYCKWIPLHQVKSWRFAKGCPSVDYNKFQPYAAGGRLTAALSYLEGRSSVTDKFVDIANNCLLCGLCDVSCKIGSYHMEPLKTMRELRFELVKNGHTLPQHKAIVEWLRKERNMMMRPGTGRGKWAEGLKVKDLNKETANVSSMLVASPAMIQICRR